MSNYDIEYYRKNRKRLLTYKRRYYAEYRRKKRTKILLVKSKYRRKYRDSINLRVRRYLKKISQPIRQFVIQQYGGKCTCCGESHIEFLAIDHINGGGNKQRK